MDLIQRAIDTHGANTVYKAAIKQLEGDSKPLATVGLIAETMGVVWAIMSQSYEQMTKQERAEDYWGAHKTSILRPNPK